MMFGVYCTRNLIATKRRVFSR